jgi:hypothetical protein
MAPKKKQGSSSFLKKGTKQPLLSLAALKKKFGGIVFFTSYYAPLG